MKRILPLCIAILIVFSCKKNNSSDPGPDPTPTPPASGKDISLITTSAVPGEFVIAQANFRPVKDTATIMVGSKPVLAVILDSNRVAFLMPELPAGSNASIQFKNIGVDKQLNIAVGNYNTISNADEIFEAYAVEENKIIQVLEEYKNDTVIRLEPAYIESIKYIRQNVAAKFASLTADEKKQVAYVLRSNMLNANGFRTQVSNPLFYYRQQALIQDPEDVAWATSASVQLKISTGLGKISIGVALVASGMLVAPVPYFGIVAGIGAAVVGANYFVDGANLIEQGIAQARALSKSVSKAGQGIEGTRTMADPIQLVKDIEKRVVFKGSFRSFTQSDKNSANALDKKFFAALDIVAKGYKEMVDGYEKIKSYLLGTAPVIPAYDLEIPSQTFSKKLTMQGEKLSILPSSVSNPGITVTYVKEEGSLVLKATSSTITQATPFSFNVVYTNVTTGTTVTEKIDAVYKAVSYKLGLNLVNTTPVSTDPIAFGNDDGKFFVLLNDDNSPAQNIDYSKISIAGITNSNITAKVQLGGSGTYGSFLLTLHSNQTSKQTTSLDVLYQSQKIQTINASVSDSIAIYKAHLAGNWKVVIRDVNTDGLIYTDYVTINESGYWVYQREDPNGVISVYDPKYGPHPWNVTGDAANGYRFSTYTQVSGRLSYPVNQMIAPGQLYRHYFTRL